MQAFFDFWDQWNGLATIICGVYATLLAYGYLPRNPKDPAKLEVWRKKFGATMKVLSPLVILVGTVTLVNAQLKDDSIEAEVKQVNQALPKMVDQITRLDRAIAGPGQRITYEHTVMTIKSSQITIDAWLQFSRQLRQNLFKGAEVRRLYRKKVTQVFRYNDTNGLLIGELEILPSDPAP